MRIKHLRLLTQHASFAVLSFGGNFGVNLSKSLPCLACPYVSNCGGRCYIYRLQSDLALPFTSLFSTSGQEALMALLLFLGLIIVFGKSWCGWICPFGLVQDWVTGIRKFFGIREGQLNKRLLAALDYAKYISLAWLILPALLSADVDLYHSFCRVCPVRTILPPFFSGFSFNPLWALDSTNLMTLSISIALMVFTGSVLVGIFFRERFFCYFCPMAAFMHILKPLTLLRLVKEPSACHGCGTCRRKCTMGIDASYKERVKTEVQADGCSGCFGCVESCSSEGALKIKFGPKVIFSSSRSHAAGQLSTPGPIKRLRDFIRAKIKAKTGATFNS